MLARMPVKWERAYRLKPVAGDAHARYNRRPECAPQLKCLNHG